MFETLESVGPLVAGYDEHRFLHLEGQFPELNEGLSGNRVEDEQSLLKVSGNGLSPVTSDSPSPHLQGLPPSETVEETQRFYL